MEVFVKELAEKINPTQSLVVPSIGGKSQDLPRLFVVIRKIQKYKAFYRPYNHDQLI